MTKDTTFYLKKTNAKKGSVSYAHTAFWLACASLFILVILHVLEPEFDPSWRFVSEYSNGKYGWIMKLGFFSMGFSYIALFLHLKSFVITKAGKLGLLLLLLAGLSGVLAGIFDMDPINTPNDQSTLQGKMHGLIALIGIPLLPIAALFTSYSLTRQSHPWRKRRALILTLAHLTWISLVGMQVILFSSLGKTSGKFGPSVPIGWPNRIVILCFLIWVIVMAKVSIKKEV